MTLSYLTFHLLFVLPPLGVLWASLPTLPPRRRLVGGVGLALMTSVAVLYTTPWDNYLIERGVWWFGEGRVAVRLLSAPLGEYLFFVFQSLLTGFWLYRVGFDPSAEPGDFARGPRVAGAAVLLALSAGGAALLGTESTYYLGAILVWACPILALQWAVGGAYLLRTWRRWVVAVAVPTAYLWFADRLAIGLGVWIIADDTATGLTLVGLPIEEAAFFLVTNLLLVYGLVLFEWVMDWWR
jgi:lycopene cyclase domain-containing protein